MRASDGHLPSEEDETINVSEDDDKTGSPPHVGACKRTLTSMQASRSNPVVGNVVTRPELVLHNEEDDNMDVEEEDHLSTAGNSSGSTNTSILAKEPSTSAVSMSSTGSIPPSSGAITSQPTQSVGHPPGTSRQNIVLSQPTSTQGGPTPGMFLTPNAFQNQQGANFNCLNPFQWFGPWSLMQGLSPFNPSTVTPFQLQQQQQHQLIGNFGGTFMNPPSQIGSGVNVQSNQTVPTSVAEGGTNSTGVLSSPSAHSSSVGQGSRIDHINSSQGRQQTSTSKSRSTPSSHHSRSVGPVDPHSSRSVGSVDRRSSRSVGSVDRNNQSNYMDPADVPSTSGHDPDPPAAIVGLGFISSEESDASDDISDDSPSAGEVESDLDDPDYDTSEVFGSPSRADTQPSGSGSKKSGDLRCFDPKVISPILDKVASVLGLEMTFDDDDTFDPLFLGDFGQSTSSSVPALKLPDKFRDVISKVRRNTSRKFPRISSVLRVVPEDFKDLFNVPPVDPDILEFIQDKNRTSRTPQFYCPAWDGELKQLDLITRLTMRLLAFQVLLSNASSLDEDLANSNEARELEVTLAAQSFKFLSRLSVLITKSRRSNVIQSIKHDLVSSLVDGLNKVSLDENPSQLFGGQFKKVTKSVAKLKVNQKTLAKVSFPQRSSFRTQASYSRPNLSFKPYRNSRSDSARGRTPSGRGKYSGGNFRDSRPGSSSKRGTKRYNESGHKFTTRPSSFSSSRDIGQAPKRFKTSSGQPKRRF